MTSIRTKDEARLRLEYYLRVCGREDKAESIALQSQGFADLHQCTGWCWSFSTKRWRYRVDNTGKVKEASVAFMHATGRLPID